MTYHVIGTMSGSSMDGLDIVYTSITETAGKWSFVINSADCIAFPHDWSMRLHQLQNISARELLLTHTEFGHWMGQQIQQFISTHDLDHKVHLIASHGHTVFHEPEKKMTFQMGDGAAIAGINRLPVVTDLRNMDIALGGQGAPIIPIGEKLFWDQYQYFLNIGGICNITLHPDDLPFAFDICAANRVLNILSNELGKTHDHNGEEAATGNLNEDLLYELDQLDYYQRPFPKSLSNEFGTDIVLQILLRYNISVHDKLFTYCRHIATQITNVCRQHTGGPAQMLVTGGGAYNTHLINELKFNLQSKNIAVVIPGDDLIQYKEALVMALIGVLRWREENNVLNSVTGASRSSVGGALWMGQE